MRSLYQNIHQACSSLSALFVPYNQSTKSLPEGFKVNPVVISEPREQVDTLVESVSPEPGRASRLKFLFSFWFCDQFEAVEPSFSATCRDWLAIQCSTTGPLQVLHDLGHLTKPDVLNAALSAILQSIACIHIYDKCPTIGKARQFIIDFTEVCATLNSAILNNSMVINQITIKSGFDYYLCTMKQVTDTHELKVLLDMVMSSEATDSSSSEKTEAVDPEEDDIDKTADLIPVWQPLYTPEDAERSLVPFPEYFTKHHKLVLEQDSPS